MIVLPNKQYKNDTNEKISTYQFLASAKCPVFDSVLLDQNEEITSEKLEQVKKILKTDYCTVRYQYIKPCSNPVKGGNKSLIDMESLKSKKIEGTQMWLLKPIDRTKNIYGINVCVNRTQGFIMIECVGRGFDVSDLNRGEISPHQSIQLEYPIMYGGQEEWWKYAKIKLTTDSRFQNDKQIRLNKLKNFGLQATSKIFDEKFKPMDQSLCEKIIKHIEVIDFCWNKSDEYTVSISMNEDLKLVFWYIQTPKGKRKILGRTI